MLDFFDELLNGSGFSFCTLCSLTTSKEKDCRVAVFFLWLFIPGDGDEPPSPGMRHIFC
jgi:hypothetical protein